MTRLYLAHPHSQRAYGKYIQALLEGSGYDVLNPFDRPDQIVFDQAIKDGRAFTEHEVEVLVEVDLEAMVNCDAVVAIWAGDGLTIGTPMEVVYAYTDYNLPVYSLYKITYLGNGVVHPWVAYHSRVSFTEEALVKDIKHDWH